jgi:hypothetical protein
MVKLFIPKTKIIFNSQHDLIDEKGNLVYRHTTNFSQTKRAIVNAENEIVMSSNTVFGFLEKHAITQNKRLITEVSYKSIWSRAIVSQNGLDIREKGYMQFSIFRSNEEVLSITKSKQKEYSYIVNVKENQIDFLVMLMFTVIVMRNSINAF